MSGELDFIQLLWRQIKLFQAAPEVIEGLINRVGHQKQAQVFGADHSPFDQRVKIDNFVPEFRAEQNDRHGLAWLLGLNQRQYFKEFIHRAETAGKDHQGLGQIDEPEFAHEKVMKSEDHVG